MRKVGLLLAILAPFYLAYPYWSLYRLSEGLEVGDEGALKHYVDWPAVRSGLKEDLSGILSRETGRAIASADGEAAVGGLLASTLGNMLLDPLVDALVTPEGLAAMIREGGAGMGGPARDGQSGTTTRGHGSLWERLSFAFFTGPRTFEAVIETDQGEDMIGEMRLNGLRWQLVRVRLPDSLGTSGLDSTSSVPPEDAEPEDEERRSERSEP